MLGTLKSLATTMKIAFRRPVTNEYPTQAAPLAPRFMAHPVLTWDNEVPEPFCTGCLVCMRICPTDCITVSMKDNPKFQAGESKRRKIVEDFELNVADCIMCGLCVEYCNFDAIIMSDHFDASRYNRPSLVHGLEDLLEEGREQEAKGRWSPPAQKKSERRSAAQGARTPTGGVVVSETSDDVSAPQPVAATASEDRVAAARAKAAELRAQKARERGEAPPATDAAAPSAPAQPQPQDERVAAARAKAAALRAQKALERGEAPPADALTAPAPPPDGDAAQPSVDPRVAEARRRAAELRAQKARERGEEPPADPAAGKEVDPRVLEARQRVAELKAQRAAERGEATPETPTPQAAAPTPMPASAVPEETPPSDKPVDPRVAEARRKAAELRAQKAREREAQQKSAGEDSKEDSPS
jgi:NADH-quinone oxidoreductase subunit I